MAKYKVSDHPKIVSCTTHTWSEEHHDDRQCVSRFLPVWSACYNTASKSLHAYLKLRRMFALIHYISFIRFTYRVWVFLIVTKSDQYLPSVWKYSSSTLKWFQQTFQEKSSQNRFTIQYFCSCVEASLYREYRAYWILWSVAVWAEQIESYAPCSKRSVNNEEEYAFCSFTKKELKITLQLCTLSNIFD